MLLLVSRDPVRLFLILIFCTAKSLLGHHALVWMVVFQDGWLHVIWKWNKSVSAWEYGIMVGVDGKTYMSVMGKVGV